MKKKRSLRFGLNTVRNATLDEWIYLWLEVHNYHTILPEEVPELASSIEKQLDSIKADVRTNLFELAYKSIFDPHL